MQGATAKCSRVNFKARPNIQTSPVRGHAYRKSVQTVSSKPTLVSRFFFLKKSEICLPCAITRTENLSPLMRFRSSPTRKLIHAFSREGVRVDAFSREGKAVFRPQAVLAEMHDPPRSHEPCIR